MAQSLNKVLIIGNLGKDPEVRYTPNGKPVCNLSVATSSRARDKAGEWVDVTQWHRVTVLGDSAEWVGKNLTKGRTVYLEGQLKYGQYTNKDGARIPTVEIVTFSVEPFGPKRGEATKEGAPAGDGAPGQDAAFQDPALNDWIQDYDKA